ncbi:MAG: ferritin-like domain-containing protein [Burkholderiales bacterium]
MSTLHRYTLPVEETHWHVEGGNAVSFTWDYDSTSDDLLRLYAKGKQQQWDADTRIDWSLSVDPDDPMQIDDALLPVYGTPLWNKLSARQKSDLRYHNQVFQLSQFLHGEQGALICSAKIVQDVPRIESKFYAATQVMDEARHVEVYRRLLNEKFRFCYPITAPLKLLLEKAIADRRWDFTYLAMQVLIEGLALAAFQRIRDYAKNRLCATINAYVMQDEARHVAFGRYALRDFYPQLTAAERREREEFVIEASYMMRDRMNSPEMWEHIGIDPNDAEAAVQNSDSMVRYRMRLFSRIVPTVRDIGLWSDEVRKAYSDLGAIQYADSDADKLLADDANVAEEFDKLMANGGAALPRKATPTGRTDHLR